MKASNINFAVSVAYPREIPSSICKRSEQFQRRRSGSCYRPAPTCLETSIVTMGNQRPVVCKQIMYFFPVSALSDLSCNVYSPIGFMIQLSTYFVLQQ